MAKRNKYEYNQEDVIIDRIIRRLRGSRPEPGNQKPSFSESHPARQEFYKMINSGVDSPRVGHDEYHDPVPESPGKPFVQEQPLNDYMHGWRDFSGNMDLDIPESDISSIKKEQKVKAPSFNDMSFGRAFQEARKQGLKEFKWKGNLYHTRTKEEEDAEREKESIRKNVGYRNVKAQENNLKELGSNIFEMYNSRLNIR